MARNFQVNAPWKKGLNDCVELQVTFVLTRSLVMVLFESPVVPGRKMDRKQVLMSVVKSKAVMLKYAVVLDTFEAFPMVAGISTKDGKPSS